MSLYTFNTPEIHFQALAIHFYTQAESVWKCIESVFAVFHTPAIHFLYTQIEGLERSSIVYLYNLYISLKKDE